MTVLELQKQKEEVILERIVPLLENDRAMRLMVYKYLQARGCRSDGIDYEIVNTLRGELRTVNASTTCT